MCETKEFRLWANRQAMSELMVLEEIRRMEAKYRPGELKIEEPHGKDWVEVSKL